MCETWDNVGLRGGLFKPWNVDVTCVCKGQYCSIWQHDSERVIVNLFVENIGTCAEEMAGCSGVTECGVVVWCVASC